MKTLLANHLFGKLATSPDFTIDKGCKSKRGKKCSCSDENCVLTGDFGDTSIGNLEVWHGSVDIIVKNDLVIENLEKEPDSPGGRSPVEVKMKSLTDEMLPFKACFFEEANNRKIVYENGLQMHNVGQTPIKEIILPNEWEFNDFLMESRRRIGEWKLKQKK